MTAFQKHVSPMAALFAAGLLAGCANGPLFQAVEPVPSDKAQVYVYRPSTFYGAAAPHKVQLDGQDQPADLSNGGWLRVIVIPGPHMVALRDFLGTYHCGPAVTVDLQPGGTAYVRDAVRYAGMSAGMAQVACEIAIRPQEAAHEELKTLRSVQQI